MRLYLYVFVETNFIFFWSNSSEIVRLILKPFSDERTFGGPFVVDFSIMLATAATPPPRITNRGRDKKRHKVYAGLGESSLLLFLSFFFLPSFAYTCRKTILYCIPRVNFTVLGNDSADSCYKSAFH